MVPVNLTPVSLFDASLVPMAPAASAQGPQSLAGGAIGQTIGQIGLGANPAASQAAPFADLLTEAVGDVQHLEVQAKSAIQGLISGRGVDVHEAMIAAQKAGMGFELMLAVRNKALAAYQQVMGMQF